VHPQLADKQGGPDFLCANGKFVVAATAFTIDKVISDSSLPNELLGDIGVHAYRLLTRHISERAGKKHSQLAVGKPAIMAMVCDHVGSLLLFDTNAAQYLITSEPFWTGGSAEMSVDLSLSAFLRLEPDNEIVPYNTNISAIILVSVTHDASYVCGALHAQSENSFDGQLLWEIPFVQCKDWPIKNKRVRVAWTLGTNPRPLRVPHESIRIESS
jgi:hypothetical protein